uniref:Glycosyltransferase RgtA/B/C/D-like domain-containing protein n=1 Tax=Anopheles merus TaxID=30066 RepID=A0A182VFL2_ANOME
MGGYSGTHDILLLVEQLHSNLKSMESSSMGFPSSTAEIFAVCFDKRWSCLLEQSHKSYRPLCVLTFRWNYLLHGLEPAGYHLVNVLLHTIVSLMYFRMCAMLLSETASFAAALLFAVHPIHTEAVTGVVGRAETLSSVFFLAAFIFYTKATRRKKSTGWRFLCLSMLFVATAMLCKEQGITITGVCAIYEIFVAQKKGKKGEHEESEFQCRMGEVTNGFECHESVFLE